MKISEAHSLGGHAIEFGGLEIRIAEATESGVAHVVNHDDDEIGPVIFRGGAEAESDDAEQNAEVRSEAIHGEKGYDECLQLQAQRGSAKFLPDATQDNFWDK